MAVWQLLLNSCIRHEKRYGQTSETNFYNLWQTDTHYDKFATMGDIITPPYSLCSCSIFWNLVHNFSYVAMKTECMHGLRVWYVYTLDM